MVSELLKFRWGVRLGRADRFENLSTVSFGGNKIDLYLFRFVFTNCFCIALLNLLEEMAGNSQTTVKTVNIHQSKIDVVKFDNMNNFGMWTCKLIDALKASNLENALLLERKPEETSEKDWDRMNQMACDTIRTCLTQDIKYYVMNKDF